MGWFCGLTDLLRALATGIIVYGALLAVSWLTLASAPDGARTNVAAAFASGDLTPFDLSGANAAIGAHQLNDCLILDQAIMRAGTRAQMTVTPPNDLANRASNVCGQLRVSLDGKSAERNFYQNYVHGHTVLARALIGVLSLKATRALYSMVVLSLIVVGLLVTMRQALNVGATVNVVFWLCFLAVFARFYGLEYFGQSLGHAPADATFIGYALWLAHASFREQERPVNFVVPCAVFGALTVIFEFLTGGLPLGIALTIAGVALFERRDKHLGHTVVRAVASFVVGGAAVVATKITLTLALFGPSAVSAAGSQLAARVGGSAQLAQIPPVTLGNVVRRVAQGMDQMVGNQSAFVLMIFLLAVGFGLVGFLRLWRTDFRQRAMLIAGSNLVLLVWVAVFNHHFYVHAIFMVRIFAWTMATGFALFAIAVGHSARRSELVTA